MNITKTALSPSARYQSQPTQATTETQAETAPTDSFSFSPGLSKAKNMLMFGAMGAVPVMGAASNIMGAWATAWDDSSKGEGGFRPVVGVAGAAANLGGTVTGIVGLFTGSDTVKMVGLGLIGASALAGATLIAATD